MQFVPKFLSTAGELNTG